MRVTCESCGATYNLPDAKVRGRKAKVRCKRCSGTIVVDGTSLPPSSSSAAAGSGPSFADGEDDEATQVIQSPLAAMPGPGEWTVNLRDDDQRSMTTQQIVEGWASGTVPQDAFVWRDGMEDWLGVLDVPELARAIADAQSESETPHLDTSAGNASPFGATRNPTPGTPAAAAFGTAAGTFGGLTSGAKATPSPAAAKARPATFDLFGPPRSLERGSQPAPAGGGASAPATTSENSVMFSLEALKAAAGKTESRPADSRASEDLLTLGGFDAVPSPMSAPLIEVLPSRPPAPDFSRAASTGPVPAMAAPAPAPRKKTPVVVWAAAAVTVLGLGFVGGRMLTSNSEAEQAAQLASAQRAAEALAASARAAEQKAEEAAAKAEAERKKAEEEQATAAKAEADKNVGAKIGGGSSGSSAGTGSGSGSGSSGSSAGSGSGSSGSSTGSGSGSGSSGSSAGSGSKPSGGGKSFDVGAAKAALSSAAAQASSSCKSSGGPTGSGKVQVTFAPSGRVTSARVVSGPFGGSSVGGCVARTFRAAKVPAFDGDSTTVSKSFTIN
jgi:predicted Zn finger-like uncharacterized protein